MNLHRTFIAIPLSAEARRMLAPIVEKVKRSMPEGAFRFVDSRNWHITLSFLGNQDDEGVGRVVSALPSLVPMLEIPQTVYFEKVVYGPDAENPSTIIIAADAAGSLALGETRDMLEDGLIAHEAKFRPDNRRFMAHITIARRTKESVLLPELNDPIEFVVSPESIDVLESVPQSDGSENELLASVSFRDEF